MTAARLSRLQRRILAWLATKAQHLPRPREARRREVQRILVGGSGAIVALGIIWAIVEDVQGNQVAMDRTALYYALSTLAQVAAALAALIGLFGGWQLDRIRNEQVQLEQELRWLLHGVCLKTEEMLILPVGELIARAQAYVGTDYRAMVEAGFNAGSDIHVMLANRFSWYC